MNILPALKEGLSELPLVSRTAKNMDILAPVASLCRCAAALLGTFEMSDDGVSLEVSQHSGSTGGHLSCGGWRVIGSCTKEIRRIVPWYVHDALDLSCSLVAGCSWLDVPASSAGGYCERCIKYQCEGQLHQCRLVSLLCVSEAILVRIYPTKQTMAGCANWLPVHSCGIVSGSSTIFE